MARRGASRGRCNGTPALAWLFAGILIGIGLSWYLFAKGLMPQPAGDAASGESAIPPRDEEPLLEDAGKDEGRDKPRYDFFTVLPEMEVVVPEQELAEQRQQAATPGASTAGASGGYLLQVGSFQSSEDAEELKAQLALMGVVAQVQTVTVNDAAWHRVRVGPLATAREADEIRRRLEGGGIESLVMKNPQQPDSTN